MFLILKMANRIDIDAARALSDTLEEYGKRMPAGEVKDSGHANVHAGGVDDKE